MSKGLNSRLGHFLGEQARLLSRRSRAGKTQSLTNFIGPLTNYVKLSNK